MGTSTNPSLYRCPLTWQQPDISVNNFNSFVFEPLWFSYSVRSAPLLGSTLAIFQSASAHPFCYNPLDSRTRSAKAGSAPTPRISEPYFANKAACNPFCSQHVSFTQSRSFSTIQKCRLGEIWSSYSTEFWEIGCSGLLGWVAGFLSPRVSKDSTVFIFKGLLDAHELMLKK